MEGHIKKGSKEQIKCLECEYSCNKKITLKKHINTKHQITNEALSNTESESEGEFDLFQLEIVSDEEVYVWILKMKLRRTLKRHIRKSLNFTRKRIY